MSRSSSQPGKPGHVSARLLIPAIRCLREGGIGPEPLASEARVPEEALSDPDVRISGEAMFTFLTLAMESSKDPAFGLHAGQQLRPGDMGLLEYLVRTAASPEEIGKKLSKYYRLAGNLQPEIEPGDEGVVVRLPITGAFRPPPVVEEYNLSFWAKLANTIRGDDSRPLAVMFTHEKVAYAEEIERVLGAPARFDCVKNGLLYAPNVLSSLLSPVDVGLSRAIGERADEALAALGSTHSVVDRVRAQIRKQLRGDSVTADTVAKEIGMSARTLRRRLEAEKTTFQDLREAERKQRALEHMREAQLSISEIAYLLGFAEPSAFHRAFRRWTGMTPAQYREAENP